MRQTEIPRAQWPAFCSSFGREHHGWLVTLGEVDTGRLDREAQEARVTMVRIAEGVELSQVTYDRAGDRIVIEARDHGRQACWAVADPQRVLVESENDAHRGLRLDGRLGKTLLVEFRVAAAPETLDGLAESELR